MTTRVPYSMTDGPVNVRAYGAKGDGSTNDTAAIQAAITAAVGTVFFPKGNYLVNTGLTIPSSCHLEFEAGANLRVDVELTANCRLADQLDELAQVSAGYGVDLKHRPHNGGYVLVGGVEESVGWAARCARRYGHMPRSGA